MKKHLLIIAIILFSSINLFSQAQLVQSFVEENVTSNTHFGVSVSNAGDVNGDGYDDIIIGADAYSNNIGRAYIFYGGASMDNTADIIMTGEGYSYFGHSVSTAGDVNNDGYDDVIVGAYEYNSSTGRTYIYYGGSSMDNIADVVMTGEGYSWFGNSVSNAGDLNNDGYDDVIVGANTYNNNIGRVYIYYGGNSMDNVADITMTGEASPSYLGYSVSLAGDVNADGYDDVIVGARAYNSETGRAYVYYGGSSMDNSADIIFNGEATNNLFGHSVSAAGDVNNDGYDDVVVGALHYNGQTGRTYIYYGGSAMDNLANLVLDGEAVNNNFGISVSTAGDVNNDGFDDIIVGASGYSGRTGRAYVYFGGNSMDNSADIIMTGEDFNRDFGYSVSTAGDVNNDGYNDVIVGIYKYNSYTCRAEIHLGNSNMDNIAYVIMSGENSDNNFGYSISTAGDVNNDGYDDIIVGAYGYNAETGCAYIYYGGSNMDNIADVTMTGETMGDSFGYSVSTAGDINNDGYNDIIVGARIAGKAYIYFGGTSMNNVYDIIMISEGCCDYFGISVSTAGDVNNDGYDDVVVGASGYSSYSYTGRAYIYLGGATMDNIADITITGDGINLGLGHSVSTAGDVNNDGYCDVIIGTQSYFTTGRAYVFLGGSDMDNVPDVTMMDDVTGTYFGASVSTAGDVNNDGYDDVIVGADNSNVTSGQAYIYYGGNSMDNNADITVNGDNRLSQFGTSVSTAGDVNNDGYDDVVIGAPLYYDNTGQNTGKVYT